MDKQLLSFSPNPDVQITPNYHYREPHTESGLGLSGSDSVPPVSWVNAECLSPMQGEVTVSFNVDQGVYDKLQALAGPGLNSSCEVKVRLRADACAPITLLRIVDRVEYLRAYTDSQAAPTIDDILEDLAVLAEALHIELDPGEPANPVG